MRIREEKEQTGVDLSGVRLFSNADGTRSLLYNEATNENLGFVKGYADPAHVDYERSPVSVILKDPEIVVIRVRNEMFFSIKKKRD